MADRKTEIKGEIDKKEESMSVPYIVHEAAQVRAERIIRRQSIAIVIIAVLAIVGVFLTAYLIDKGWRDYLSESVIENYSVFTDGGGNANYIGQDGDIYNGESKSQKDNT